ncbi:MAG TPA: hypothetical protein VMT00_02430 [Thermoanaerobaculia bacterium]|nr:hypothetical protein [Thermoanaerobaculia bacterium]
MTGNFVYTAGGLQRLGDVTVDFLVVDITNRAAPAIVGFNTFAGRGSPSSIRVGGDFVYATTSRGLSIFDIVNRTSPVSRSDIALAGINSSQVRVSNGRAYVVGSGFPGPSRLYVVDVTNAAEPKVLGSYAESSNFYDLEVAGNTVYVATHLPAGNLLIIDVTNPAAPVKVGTFTEAGINRISNVALRGDALIAIGETADFNDHLLIVDVTNRVAPRRLATIDLASGGAQDIAVTGHRAIILDASRGRLLFFDVSKPEQTKSVGEFAINSPFQFAAEATTAAVLQFSTTSLGLFDIANCLASTPRRRAVARR